MDDEIGNGVGLEAWRLEWTLVLGLNPFKGRVDEVDRIIGGIGPLEQPGSAEFEAGFLGDDEVGSKPLPESVKGLPEGVVGGLDFLAGINLTGKDFALDKFWTCVGEEDQRGGGRCCWLGGRDFDALDVDFEGAPNCDPP